ncbi:lysozyme inhibitor LprI family protein [Enterobacteriaceae bacterium LUAb1]
MNKILLITTLIAAPVSSAFAVSCHNPVNSYDKTYCSALEMVQADQNINEQYRKTINVLNNAQKSLLKKAQIQWIRDRDAECSNNGIIEVGCVNEKMKKRTETLKKIERECKAAGCDNTTLTNIE